MGKTAGSRMYAWPAVSFVQRGPSDRRRTRRPGHRPQRLVAPRTQPGTGVPFAIWSAGLRSSWRHESGGTSVIRGSCKRRQYEGPCCSSSAVSCWPRTTGRRTGTSESRTPTGASCRAAPHCRLSCRIRCHQSLTTGHCRSTSSSQHRTRAQHHTFGGSCWLARFPRTAGTAAPGQRPAGGGDSPGNGPCPRQRRTVDDRGHAARRSRAPRRRRTTRRRVAIPDR